MYYIVYAHEYTNCYDGLGLEKRIIGIAASEPEAKTIMKTFQEKFPHNKNDNWITFHADDNDDNLIRCSIESFTNEYL